MHDVGSRYHVVVQVSDDFGQGIGIGHPGHGTIEGREGIEIASETTHGMVFHGHFMFRGMPFVEHRKEFIGRVRVGIEVTYHDIGHIIHPA